MSALAKWFKRWQRIAIHGAMLAGAKPEAVAGALGNNRTYSFERVLKGSLMFQRTLGQPTQIRR
jgi:hypothetical protein